MKPGYCRRSPTKAHHWMFRPQGSDGNKAECKYCGKEREFRHKGPYDPTSKEEIHAEQLGGYLRPSIVPGRKIQ